MEQLQLFNLENFDEQEFQKRSSKIRLNYKTLLVITPESQDEELYKWAIIFRKCLGELLIELENKQLWAKFYLTDKQFKKRREQLCEIADINPENLEVWTQQIIDGALCFNYRILDDHIKRFLDIRKNAPTPDLDVEEDWDKDNFTDNQLSLDL